MTLSARRTSIALFALLVSTSFWEAQAATTPKRVTFRLVRKSPSRITCTISNDDGDQRTIQFDPAVPGDATKSFDLNVDTTGTDANKAWHIACDAAPYHTDMLQAGVQLSVNVAWQIAPVNLAVTCQAPSPCTNPPCTAASCATPITAHIADPTFVVDTSGSKIAYKLDTPKDEPVIMVTVGKQLALKQARKGLAVPNGGSVGGRSLDSTAPQLLQDTLSILAKIALDRGKTRAFAIIKDKVTQVLCTDLKIPKELESAFPNRTLLLPDTCAAAKDLSIATIAEAAPAIERALESDVVSFATGAALAKIDGWEPTTLDATAAGLEAAAALLDERREAARERQSVIAANVNLQERELIKLASLDDLRVVSAGT
jgi:hypothetical protein